MDVRASSTAPARPAGIASASLMTRPQAPLLLGCRQAGRLPRRKRARDIRRCLKRAVARQLFKLLEGHDRAVVEIIRA
jgi:hypothetical protein